MNAGEARARLLAAESIAVLTGSGVSAASGIPTFRGDGGFWRRHRAEDLATPGAYARDPVLVWQWYSERLESVLGAEPNRAHLLLANLAASVPDVTLVTQNVDGLHQAAGSRNVLELHGNLRYARCECCRNLSALEPGFDIPPRCAQCGGRARPNVVWFGEALSQAELAQAAEAFQRSRVALIVGTSAVVEPAASLGRLAASSGAFLIEVNPEATPLTQYADLSLRLAAEDGLSRLLEDGAEEAAAARRQALPQEEV